MVQSVANKSQKHHAYDKKTEEIHASYPKRLVVGRYRGGS